MINKQYLSLGNDLITEYHTLFQGNDDKKSFIFLRKYLKYIESDDEPYHRLFILKSPYAARKENQVFLKEFNETVSRYLEHMMKHGNALGKKNVKEGEVACYLGVAHEYGLFNKPLNLEVAFYYYTISAQLNSNLGTFRLAQCYERGIGTPQHISKAVYFFRCAAKLGLTDGMHVYGSILANGYLGSEKDVELGLHFLSLASLKAGKIYPYSLFDIGRWYEGSTKDTDVLSDDNYSYEIYYKGTQLKDPNCMYRIAQAYETGDLGRKISPGKAFEFYKMAAKYGQVDAQLAVSEIYFNGVGGKKQRNPSQSYFWALKAATKGSGRGAFIVGEYAFRGFGIKQDMLHALWWFTVSSHYGYEDAVKKIIELKHEVNKKDGGPYVQTSCCSLFC